jgi:hypothetical protein
VLHVLHRTPGPLPLAGDQNWMLNLPRELPDPKDTFSSGQTVVNSERAWFNDPTHHFAYPWVIIATVDAYPQGSWRRRAQASRLLHQIPEKREDISTGLRDMPWLAAETLIALRHLRGDHVI